jgi:hypothetical protein
VTCALWLGELRLERTSEGELFVRGEPAAVRAARACCVCESGAGLGPLRCRAVACQTSYHAGCALRAGFAMRARVTTALPKPGVVLEHYCTAHHMPPLPALSSLDTTHLPLRRRKPAFCSLPLFAHTPSLRRYSAIFDEQSEW